MPGYGVNRQKDADIIQDTGSTWSKENQELDLIQRSKVWTKKKWMEGVQLQCKHFKIAEFFL